MKFASGRSRPRLPAADERRDNSEEAENAMRRIARQIEKMKRDRQVRHQLDELEETRVLECTRLAELELGRRHLLAQLALQAGALLVFGIRRRQSKHDFDEPAALGEAVDKQRVLGREVNQADLFGP